jgi:hypothetical protein
LQLLLINKVISLIILFVIFQLGLSVLKNKFLAVLVVVTFVSSPFAHYMLSSIEYGTPALLFLLLSILFLFKYLSSKRIEELVLSIFSFFICGYLRYELTAIYGITYILMTNLLIEKNKPERMLLWLAGTFAAYRCLSFSVDVLSGDDVFLHGRVIEPGLWRLLQNIGQTLHHNIIEKRDLALSSGVVSLFTYSFLIASFVIASKRKYKLLSLSLDALIYILVVLCFHIEGMRSGEKYSIFYFVSEILVTYAGLMLVFKRVFFCFIFFILAFWLSPLLSFKVKLRPWEVEMSEFRKLKELALDEECLILKYRDNQPLITFYFPYKFQAIYFDEIEETIYKNRCIYHLDQKYIRNIYTREELRTTDLKKVLSRLRNCDYSTIFESEQFSLSKIDC